MGYGRGTEPTGEGRGEPTGTDGADAEDPKRNDHSLRRFFDFDVAAIGAEEGEEQETAHVKGGEEGRD